MAYSVKFALSRETPYWAAGFYMGRVFTAVREPCDDALAATSVASDRNNTVVPLRTFWKAWGIYPSDVGSENPSPSRELPPPADNPQLRPENAPGGARSPSSSR